MRFGIENLARKYGREAVADIESLLQRIDDDIDSLAHELRPPTFDDTGLRGSIAQLAARFTATSGIRVQIRDHLEERLPKNVETTIYRVAQEALTNAGKHSRAKKVTLTLNRREDHVRLAVEDDGVGFDAAARADSAATPPLGLLGMRERVQMVDGKIEIRSKPGGGTSVYVRVPLRQEETPQ
jgi:signal transduction histidine kinase